MSTSQPADNQADAKLSEEFRSVSCDVKCDLIMKGGIASGVLYPPAILELAKNYRFHQIGGTSAGAIAAAAAAAAEYGRATADQPSASGKTKGFMRLDKIAKQLAQEGFVFNLFQPSNGTKPLFDTILAIKDLFSTSKKDKPPIPTYLSRIISILRENTSKSFRSGNLRGLGWGIGIALIVTLLMLLAAVYLGATLLGDPATWIGVFVRMLLFGVVFGALTACIGWYVGGIVGSVCELVTLGKRLTDRDNSLYGICSGNKLEDDGIVELADTAPLTDWLTSILNELAGLDTHKPLTFEDLARKDIDLRLVTTNLSQGQPYVFPRKDRSFHPIFRESDMRKLFPASVVEYMMANPDTPPLSKSKVKLPDGYHFLPYGNKLPVVVATRMSLSFPILLSAVRLYTLQGWVFKKATAVEANLREHWFSDGGITSNFPIHMFDTWRPAHPTFGIKLNGWLSPTPDEAAKSKQGDIAKNIQTDGVYLPQPNDPHDIVKGIQMDGVYLPQPDDIERGGRPIWKPVKSLPSFLSQILDTMQNYHDNTQSMLPGYRERIVQVYLKDKEGGMNLNMKQAVIDGMIEKGSKAGYMLAHDFDFDQHQWVRFRVLMAQLEVVVANLKHSLPPLPDALNDTFYDRLVETYHQLIEKQSTDKWYRPMNAEDCTAAKRRVTALWGFITEWDKATDERRAKHEAQPADGRSKPPFSEEFFRHHAPKPFSVLRVTPEL